MDRCDVTLAFASVNRFRDMLLLHLHSARMQSSITQKLLLFPARETVLRSLAVRCTRSPQRLHKATRVRCFPLKLRLVTSVARNLSALI